MTGDSKSERSQARADGLILTLPHEITIQIFSFYLPTYPESPPIIGPGSPTRLLEICRQWRSVALATPTLWRAIRFGSDASEAEAALVLSWLDRSAGALLSIRLEFNRRQYWSLNGSESSLLWKTILATRERWEYIHFEIPASFSASLSGVAPNLVRMNLIATWSDKVSNLMLDDSRRLCSLSLWNIHFATNSVAWSQLSSLTLISIEASKCLSVLPLATGLTQLKWDLEDFRFTNAPPVIKLPLLQQLILHAARPGPENNSTASRAPHCLDFLILPSLRNFEISFNIFERAPPAIVVDCIRNFIACSGCSLECLRFGQRKPAQTPGMAALADACAIAFPEVIIRAGIHNDSLTQGPPNIDCWMREEYWKAELE
uniref:F-box domain-containing protein n=1 Tax=Mycena chlorophos TaxID=658473 RepID=A0ABQ0L8I8_MYCCL|nr:predicted protein [Mycena chlorophos]